MMHRQILIFGYGPYGKELAQSMAELYDEVVIIDQYTRHLLKAEDDGFNKRIKINVHDDAAFAALPVKDNAVAFCAFEDEAYNTYLTISLRAEYSNLAIVAFGEHTESHHKLLMAGADKVIIVEETGANVLYNILVNPTVAHLFDQLFYLKDDLSIGEVIIRENSPISGTYLKDINRQKEYNIIILGLVDLELGHEFLFATSGRNHKIDAGDALVIIGPTAEIKRCQKDF